VDSGVKEVFTDRWDEVEAAAEYYSEQPYSVPTLIRFTTEAIKTYRELLSREDLPDTSVLKPLGKQRLKNGLCVLLPDDICSWNIPESFVNASYDSLADVIGKYGSRKKAAIKRMRKLLADPERLPAVLSFMIGNGGKRDRIAEWSAELNVKEDFLQLFLSCLISAYVLVARKDYGDVEVAVEENRTACPFCGAHPMLGRIDKDDNSLNLVCSMCRTEWRYPRLRCTSCGNTEFEELEMLYVGGEESPHRIHACRRCKHYIKLISEKQRDEPVPLFPTIVDAATVYLDIIAERKGLKGNGPAV